MFSSKGLDAILKTVFTKNTITKAEIKPILSIYEEFQNYINSKAESDQQQGLNNELFKILYDNQDTFTKIKHLNATMKESILQSVYDSGGKKN